MTAASKEHGFYCFDAILDHLNGSKITRTPSFPNDEYPLFVTWKILDSGYEPRLRGCIGSFNSMRLHKGLLDYARISAFKDSRFSPISLEEVDQLECGVSLLTNFEKGLHWQDWTIGTHGVRISFKDDMDMKYSATYLPEVAESQGWDHQQTIDSLILKSGYRRTISNDLRNQIQLERYQSSKAYVTYSEYLEARKADQN
ncbi:hypothetical protein BC833DRAFT_584365 [Globomyces pollinis-pini]|nr:hypothetical protein BC833DRAFT_584365 [Globomyces pollinis-pini]